MRRVALAALLVALHVAAASLPCPPGPPERGTLAAGPAFVHASHDATPARPDALQELRAACPCGCKHGAPGGFASARLGPALLRAAAAFEPPNASEPLRVAEPRRSDAPGAAPDPVPRVG